MASRHAACENGNDRYLCSGLEPVASLALTRAPACSNTPINAIRPLLACIYAFEHESVHFHVYDLSTQMLWIDAYTVM